jgi:tRNA-2-methylthio-N6-dimethylallyladenosine synthase
MAKDIIYEIKNLINCGHKEIMLLGQNVNSYKSDNMEQITDNKKSINFVDLLKEIVKIPGKFEIKFMTSHPKDLSNELIDLISKEPKIVKELHLPVQSGDDQILKKMNRHYTAKKYLKLILKIRAQIPNIKLSTDIIVGFPGETKKAFLNTVKLCKKAKFDLAYISQYSSRPGTASFKIKDNVPREEKKRRWRVLENLINK